MGASIPTVDEVLDEIASFAKDELRWTEPLPEGDLSEALDSMQRLALLVALEDRFRVCITPDAETGIRSVDDLVGAVRRAAQENHTEAPESTQ